MQDQSGIFQEFQKHIEAQIQEHVMTIAESLIDQGVQKGRKEEREEGEAALPIKLLSPPCLIGFFLRFAVRAMKYSRLKEIK